VTAARKGPAREAGIRPGDLIVKIDGRAVRDLSFERSLSLVKGEEGTVVQLTIERANAWRKNFRIVRDEIPVASMRGRLLRVGKTRLAYVRLLAFPQGTSERIEEETGELVARGARGLILDLRQNPGGLLDQAVRTVSVFVDHGVVCTTNGMHQSRRVFSVTGGARYPRLPLVVLVDRKSASAAEIVAAALRENGRARLVGVRTYGKASVQSIRLLSDGGAFKLTTATYRTPSGLDIHLTGVRPDVGARDDVRTRADEALVAAERTLLRQLR
jgi:carboxyl-terminal processing protease